MFHTYRAIAHGISHILGDVSVGKLADLVMWKPANFGVRPEQIIKGGVIAWAAMGDANAVRPNPRNILYLYQLTLSSSPEP